MPQAIAEDRVIVNDHQQNCLSKDVQDEIDKMPQSSCGKIPFRCGWS